MAKANPLTTFLDLDDSFRDYSTSDAVILPVPFERTTSYGRGTSHGPQAILEASQQVELFDEELRSEPYKQGIATLSPIEDSGQPIRDYLDQLQQEVSSQLDSEKFVVSLGGEHTLTQAAVAAAAQTLGTIGVVQFDAHADMRDTYEGDRFSHACVMRRVNDMGIPHLGVGIRSLSPAEAAYIETQGLEMVWGRDLDQLTPSRLRHLLEGLPAKIYLTFDVDFLDPALLPATGTPEPGGGSWWPTLSLLRVLFETREVVAMDLVELAPIAGQTTSDFTVARLAYKCLAYHQAWRSALPR